jgi:hypothetical protein
MSIAKQHAIGEELMKEYLELAISSMKNLENVRYIFVLLAELDNMILKSTQLGGTDI